MPTNARRGRPGRRADRPGQDDAATRTPGEAAGDGGGDGGSEAVWGASGEGAGGEPGMGGDTGADADTAAASALARARDAARAKGLRPGIRPMRKRRPLGQPVGGAGRDGRDPTLLGDQMDRLLVDRGWNVDVAVGAVMGRWPSIVGADVSAHCAPVTFSDGVLTVRADSTAWATQLRLMSSSILGRLEAEVGKDTVTELRVQGPSAPSWTRGLRKSTGPGPRDTYG